MNDLISRVVVAVLCLSGGAHAQEARTRSLTFDPNERTWVEESAPVAGTSEGDLFEIKTLNNNREHDKAIAGVEAFVKQYGTDDPVYPEVLLERAEALIGLRDFTAAHEALQEFLGEFAGMTLTNEALRMELVTAEAFLAGAKRRVWKILRFSGKDLAYTILDEISTGYPESPYAEAALKTKADHLFRTGEFGLAELEYARLAKDYPRSSYHQFSLRRIADAALASFAGTDYDEAALIEADERYREYAVMYPAASTHEGIDVITDGIRQSRAEKDFLVGQYYEHTKHLSSAVYYYRLVRADWPGTIAAAKATGRLVQLGVLESTGQPSVDDSSGESMAEPEVTTESSTVRSSD